MSRCPPCQAISSVPATPAGLSDLPGSNFPASGSADTSPTANPFLQPFQGNPAEAKPAASENPFRDATTGSSSGNPYGPTLNPYASPGVVNQPTNYLLTADQARSRLLGPAIGMTVGAIFGLGYLCFSIGISLMNGNLMRNAPQDDGERAAFLFGMILVFVVMGLPSLLMLLGALAMFRGKGLVLAWTGAIASLLPCSPCCILGLGFGIWGIVTLSDPRVSRIMKQA